MSEVATIECPFCASTLKAHATVCPNCHAVRGAGTDSQGNIPVAVMLPFSALFWARGPW